MAVFTALACCAPCCAQYRVSDGGITVIAPEEDAARAVLKTTKKKLAQIIETWGVEDIIARQKMEIVVRIEYGNLGYSKMFSSYGRGTADTVSLLTSRSACLAENEWDALGHELTHVITLRVWGCSVPVFFKEGAACQTPQELRSLDDWIESHCLNPHFGWPNVRELLRKWSVIDDGYCTAASVTEFLIEKGYTRNEHGHRKFLQFVLDVKEDGLEIALQKHYGYREVYQLEEQWRNWAEASVAGRGEPISDVVETDDPISDELPPLPPLRLSRPPAIPAARR